LAVFMPDRLGLVKGPASVRRVHLDRLVAALWPWRVALRQRYARALAQRNALLGRVRAGLAGVDGLDAWDRELAVQAVELRSSREAAVEAVRAPFEDLARALGLEGGASVRYVSRAPIGDAQGLTAALAERRDEDLARGFTTIGPHRDELELLLGGRSLRRYGSQGEQRAALLALLFAERQGLIDVGRPIPVMLLDDVMSELDPARRRLLADRLAAGGQALVTATEAGAFPGSPDTELIVAGGAVGPQGVTA
jgi:DNA replication and repair protein RecF